MDCRQMWHAYSVCLQKECHLKLCLAKYSPDWKLWLKSAPGRAPCAPGHLTGTDPDKTRLSEGARERARARPTLAPSESAPRPLAPLCALGEVRLIWVSARQMNRDAGGALFSHSFQSGLYQHVYVFMTFL